jgi:hypothetical protein
MADQGFGEAAQITMQQAEQTDLAASAVKPLTASNPATTRKGRRTGSGGALPKESSNRCASCGTA